MYQYDIYEMKSLYDACCDVIQRSPLTIIKDTYMFMHPVMRDIQIEASYTELVILINKIKPYTHHLNIRPKCNNNDDLSIFENVHTLILFGCTWITDVSALGNLHTLNLWSCTEITDVSALGNLHTLDISWCERITD